MNSTDETEFEELIRLREENHRLKLAAISARGFRSMFRVPVPDTGLSISLAMSRDMDSMARDLIKHLDEIEDCLP